MKRAPKLKGQRAADSQWVGRTSCICALGLVILAASLALGCGQPLKVRDVVGTWHGPDGPAYLTLSSDGTFKEDITINGNHVGNHGTFTIDGQSIRFQIESGDKATGRIDDGVLVITDPGGTTTWTR